jgi:hypothetical protein
MAEPKRDTQQLHFFPGEKRILFVVDGQVDLDVEAWGGPEFPKRKRPGEKFGESPTTPGRFRVGWIGPYVTPTWPFSGIPWGARLKPHPSMRDDLLYEASPGRWRSVRQKIGKTRGQVEAQLQALYPAGQLPDRWVLNDFGPVAIRFFEDLNNDGKRNANEPLSGEMFHTTPDNEADPSLPLFQSHACIHLRPSDRDRLMGHKAFKMGILIVIHHYGETSGVPRRQPAAQ